MAHFVGFVERINSLLVGAGGDRGWGHGLSLQTPLQRVQRQNGLK
jgi:hypothetical protein